MSVSEGCVPPVSAIGEPGDTAFFLSGSAYESASALFATQPQGITFVSSVTGAAGGALAFAAGSYLTVPFSAAPTLAVGELALNAAGDGPANAPFSIAVWVKCASSTLGVASALEFGATAPMGAKTNAALNVASALPTLFAYAATDANAPARPPSIRRT